MSYKLFLLIRTTYSKSFYVHEVLVKFYIIFVSVPHAPRNLTVTRMTNKTADLIWNEPLISTGPIITYRVHWQNSSSTGEEETRSTATFYTIRNLTPNVNYTFKVMALTEAGPGEWSVRVTGETKIGGELFNTFYCTMWNLNMSV